MASIEVSNNFFVCDHVYDLDTNWDNGTIAAVRDDIVGALYYKLIDGSFVFQYNQSGAPSIPKLADNLTVKITVGPDEPLNPAVNDIWIDTN